MNDLDATAGALARLAGALRAQPSRLDQIADELAARARQRRRADGPDGEVTDLWQILREAIAMTLKHPEYAAALLAEDEAALYADGQLADVLDAYGDEWPRRYPIGLMPPDDDQPPWP
jgi:hypothetical protein